MDVSGYHSNRKTSGVVSARRLLINKKREEEAEEEEEIEARMLKRRRCMGYREHLNSLYLNFSDSCCVVLLRNMGDEQIIAKKLFR